MSVFFLICEFVISSMPFLNDYSAHCIDLDLVVGCNCSFFCEDIQLNKMQLGLLVRVSTEDLLILELRNGISWL